MTHLLYDVIIVWRSTKHFLRCLTVTDSITSFNGFGVAFKGSKFLHLYRNRFKVVFSHRLTGLASIRECEHSSFLFAQLAPSKHAYLPGLLYFFLRVGPGGSSLSKAPTNCTKPDALLNSRHLPREESRGTTGDRTLGRDPVPRGGAERGRSST